MSFDELTTFFDDITTPFDEFTTPFDEFTSPFDDFTMSFDQMTFFLTTWLSGEYAFWRQYQQSAKSNLEIMGGHGTSDICVAGFKHNFISSLLETW